MSARHEIAALLVEQLPDTVTVYAAPPSNLSAPAVVVKMQGAEQLGPCLWHQTFQLVIVGPGGDNEAALSTLEDLILRVADSLSSEYAQPVSWDAPGIISAAGASYIAAALEVVLDVKAEQLAPLKEAV